MELEYLGKQFEWIIKEYYDGKPARLATAIGVTRSTLSPILDNKGYPSFKVLAGIMTVHPEINPDWLILGTGPQLRTLDPLHKIKKENEELRQGIEDMYRILKKRG